MTSSVKLSSQTPNHFSDQSIRIFRSTSQDQNEISLWKGSFRVGWIFELFFHLYANNLTISQPNQKWNTIYESEIHSASICIQESLKFLQKKFDQIFGENNDGTPWKNCKK